MAGGSQLMWLPGPIPTDSDSGGWGGAQVYFKKPLQGALAQPGVETTVLWHASLFLGCAWFCCHLCTLTLCIHFH